MRSSSTTTSSTHSRTRRPSQDFESVPVELLDTTCYFITADAFDTLLQCTQSNHPAQQQQQQSQTQRPRRLSISTSTTHFFTGSLVCTDPPLVLATGTSVDVLEREWQKYYVLLDLNNVAQHGRLPSLFSTFSTVHAVSKNYQLDAFGETHWMLLELAPLRKHIPSHHHETAAGAAGGLVGFMNMSNAVHPMGNVRRNRTRSRSNSLPWPSSSPSPIADDSNGSGSGSSGGDSSPSDEGLGGSSVSSGVGGGGLASSSSFSRNMTTHPELHPSHSVTFDRTQAAQAVPASPVYASYASATYHQHQQQQQLQQYQQQQQQRGRSGRRSSQSNHSTSSSVFFRQPPMQSIHSLLRARLQCLYMSSRSSCRITVRLYFSSTGGNGGGWKFSEGMMVVLDDDEITNDDCWLLGGHGRPYLVSDEEYEFTSCSGLAARDLYVRPAATIRTMRLVRRSSAWDSTAHGGGLKEWERIAPQAYLEVVDPKDDRLAFSLGPVVFEPSGVKGNEWVGTIPQFVY